MNMKKIKPRSSLFIKPRHPGQWPFSDVVTTCICRHAGREASAMLYVALHKNRADGKDSNSALQAVYYEPFTYWDWHGVDAEDESASKHKKQLVWERQRGFTATDGETDGYPTPQEAWQRFRRLIDGNTERSRWVKKIAVAHWMSVEDMSWIFQNLPSLEALDLSDVARLTVKSYQGYRKEPLAFMTDTWSLFFDRMSKKSPAKEMAPQLTWLGLPDFRDTSLVAPRILLEKFLPICTNLQTLSIRGEYKEEIPPPNLSGHEYICAFLRGITTGTPSSVTALELRLSIPFLRELLVALNAEDRLNITQIGLDLGAWVHAYPLRITSKAIQDSDVVSAASNAARKARFDTYEQVHSKVLPASSKWILPELEDEPSDMGHVSGSPGSPVFQKLHARSISQHEPYNAKGGLDIREYRCDRSKLGSRKKCSNKDPRHHKELLGSLERTYVNTLPSMLVKLRDAGQIAASQEYSLYSLKPEWQANSTIPLHPFTVIQKSQPVPTLSTEQGRDYKEPAVDRLKETYAWLNNTFSWRPVFDWDYFVGSGMESLKGNLDFAFSNIQQQYELGNTTKSNNKALIAAVATQFQIMRDAGIPIHILLGRRNSDESSLYWGWPYNSDAWEQSLKAPFDAGLAPVAAHIDTLSIFYGLRNPLDERRLEEIDRRQPYHRPDACCPRPEDPWHSTNNSPYKKRWQDRPSQISKPNTQKTANKKMIGKKFRVPLASNLTSCPPTGEYADEHAYDDPEHDKSLPETLHQVAYRAAFEREAVGWQRFWTEYAPKMTNLRELRVRMPQNFDKVGSWSLRELLGPRKTWTMFGYADERGHMQTQEDTLHHAANDFKLHTHAAQDKIWPAGRFVRRTWISWTPEPADTAEVALHRTIGEEESPTSHPSASNENTEPSKRSKFVGKKREKEELEKAVKQARETARKEQELEASLPLRSPENLVETPLEAFPRSEDIERRLTGVYGRHVRGVAERTWRSEMRGYIEQLGDGAPAREETLYNLYETPNNSQVAEATIARDVLRDTRELLLKRMQNFRPEEVFASCDYTDRMNGLELVKHTTDYAAEENKRRTDPGKEDADQTRKSQSKLPSTDPTTGTLPSGPQQLRSSPNKISSDDSSSSSSSSDEVDTPPRRFPAVSTHQATATHTSTTQQGFRTVFTSQTSQTTQVQQQDSAARQLELAQQLANNLTVGQAQKIPRFGSQPGKGPNEGERAVHQTPVGFGSTKKATKEKAAEEKRRPEEQAAKYKRLAEEKKAAVAEEAKKTKAANEARVAAETIAEAAKNKAVEEKNQADEMKKQNAEIKKQTAAEKRKAKESEAAAKKMAAEEKAAKEEAERKADEVKKQTAAEKKELKNQTDAERKKLEESKAAAKKVAAKEKAAREDAELKAHEVAEATKEAAIKAVEAVDTEDTPDVIQTIEKASPDKPTKKLTKSPKTPKGNSPRTPKGTKRKQPILSPSEADPMNKPVKVKKTRPSKGASTTSTPVRRSERIRTQTPTTQVELPSDMIVTESIGDETDDDDKQKKSKKVKTEPDSEKRRIPTKVVKATRERGGKEATPAKGKGRKRAADDENEEDEDEEADRVVKRKPAKKKAKKTDEENNA